jgi:signal transduction histidine kinase
VGEVSTVEGVGLAAPGMTSADGGVLSKLGHELRSPLAAIIGLTRILQSRLAAGETDPGEQAELLTMIESSASRSLATVEQVVDAAKIEAGRVVVERRTADGCATVAAVAAVFQPIAEARGLRLRVEVPDHPVLISTDNDLLGNLLRELVDNAVKFADAGPVLIRLTANADRSAVIEVSNDGPGIPVHDQVRVFAAFERGELAAERDDDGCGLGLYRASKLADLLGAHLSVRSEAGQRTTFTLTVPGQDDRSGSCA